MPSPTQGPQTLAPPVPSGGYPVLMVNTVEPPMEKHHVGSELGQSLVLWTQTQDAKAGEMYEDSGCNRCVAGHDVHETWQKYLSQRGLRAERLEKQEEFVFGNGKTEMSDCSFNYPVFIKGKLVGSIDIARIQADCPALFSKRMMKEWKMTLDFDKQETVIKSLDCVFPFKNTIPVLDIFQLPEAVTPENLPLCFQLRTKPTTPRNLTRYVDTQGKEEEESPSSE